MLRYVGIKRRINNSAVTVEKKQLRFCTGIKYNQTICYEVCYITTQLPGGLT